MSRTTNDGVFARITGLWPHKDIVGKKDGIYCHAQEDIVVPKGKMMLIVANPGHVKNREDKDKPSHILFVEKG